MKSGKLFGEKGDEGVLLGELLGGEVYGWVLVREMGVNASGGW